MQNKGEKKRKEKKIKDQGKDAHSLHVGNYNNKRIRNLWRQKSSLKIFSDELSAVAHVAISKAFCDVLMSSSLKLVYNDNFDLSQKTHHIVTTTPFFTTFPLI